MTEPGPLREIGGLFLRLGTTAFGGPAAHIAMMHDEVVRRRAWVSEERFVDLVGATNLIPGPNSTEMAIHLGWELGRLGWLTADQLLDAGGAGVVLWRTTLNSARPIASGAAIGIAHAVLA